MAMEKIIDVHCGWGASGAATGWNDIGTIQTAMGARGIRQAYVSSLLARRYDLPTGNDALAGAIVASPDETVTDLRGWLVIHPARTSESYAQMRKHLYNERFVGAALYADPLTGAPVLERDARDIITAFRRYAKPLLVETPTAQAMAEAVVIADAMAGAKVIASGMGGDEWREAIYLAARPLNLFLDISGALMPEKIEYALEILHGSRKLLFASGAPQTDPAALIGLLDDLDLPREDRERILHINAERVFQTGGAVERQISLTPMDNGEGAATTTIDDILSTLGQPSEE